MNVTKGHRAIAKKPTQRPFCGPRTHLLPADFAMHAVNACLSLSGFARVEATARSGQDCRWSGYLREIAKACDYQFSMKRSGGRVYYYMHATLEHQGHE
jgi:hypothetical protein